MATPHVSKSNFISGSKLKHVSLTVGGVVGVGIAADALVTKLVIKRAPSSKNSATASRASLTSESGSLAKHKTMSSASKSRGGVSTSQAGVVKPADTRSIGPVGQATCGALAGAIARCIVAPLDVVKIRLQCQLEPCHLSTAKYHTVLGSMATIVKEEGMVGLWRGTVPAILFWMPYTAVQFTVLDQFNRHAAKSQYLSQCDQTWKQFMGGAVAGAAATMTSYPLDLIRTNMAAQGTPKVYNTLFECASGIVAKRGVSGLFAGLTPTLLEIIPQSSLQIGSYDLFKRMITWAHGQQDGNPVELQSYEKFWAGFAAGLLAKSMVHPLDVVKKRFQVAGLQRSTRYGLNVTMNQYTSLTNALVKIARMEGYRGLYKGLAPNLLKAAPSSALTFMFYEKLVSLMNERLAQQEAD
mmetsp:Transcript_33576/g.73274  ORF Transcript_33576/g.73274 Transcript_33576/m.73274 type:complete len:411 (-) Transcript_33576:475-1707(-)|eukprot:CAMPEP_0118955672 /NCGR_PEP_ID=MMETSP1169-20130426/60331_1 /TAXON_ID=36882 /ORGANISM="Pyramimonas obovata, Strain CCMP722" /LENGTH=410 /DNA_ID=CAMNT_0006903561 /DNA_START=171 /DNA_END=1403 /DNA_ORIENTATION=+